MENQPKKLDNAVKISIIAGILIVAFSIGYYLVIFIPKKAQLQIEQQKEELLSNAKQKGEDAQKKEADRQSQKAEDLLARKKNQQDQDACILAVADLAEKQMNLVKTSIDKDCSDLEGSVAMECYNKRTEMIDDISKKFNEDKKLCYQRFPVN
ncbi:MAG: hypothetical protein ACOYS2_01835 [Patescibacteria group bacterium]